MRRTVPAYRGRAANVWSAGADGVYVFNIFDPGSPLWRDLGDAKRLASLDKDYFGSIRGTVRAAGGNLPYAKFQQAETLNPAAAKTIARGQKSAAKIQIGEGKAELQAGKFKLRLQLRGVDSAGDLATTINDRPVGPLRADGEWFECELAKGALQTGSNLVEVALSAKSRSDAKWLDLAIERR
jgi:hypothetical protein